MYTFYQTSCFIKHVLSDSLINDMYILSFYKVNKKLLQQQIVQETGKQVTLKDLSNIAAKYKEDVKSFNEV